MLWMPWPHKEDWSELTHKPVLQAITAAHEQRSDGVEWKVLGHFGEEDATVVASEPAPPADATVVASEPAATAGDTAPSTAAASGTQAPLSSSARTGGCTASFAPWCECSLKVSQQIGLARCELGLNWVWTWFELCCECPGAFGCSELVRTCLQHRHGIRAESLPKACRDAGARQPARERVRPQRAERADSWSGERGTSSRKRAIARCHQRRHRMLISATSFDVGSITCVRSLAKLPDSESALHARQV